jgi:hypothetical protein
VLEGVENYVLWRPLWDSEALKVSCSLHSPLSIPIQPYWRFRNILRSLSLCTLSTLVGSFTHEVQFQCLYSRPLLTSSIYNMCLKIILRNDLNIIHAVSLLCLYICLHNPNFTLTRCTWCVLWFCFISARSFINFVHYGLYMCSCSHESPSRLCDRYFAPMEFKGKDLLIFWECLTTILHYFPYISIALVLMVPEMWSSLTAVCLARGISLRGVTCLAYRFRITKNSGIQICTPKLLVYISSCAQSIIYI